MRPAVWGLQFGTCRKRPAVCGPHHEPNSMWPAARGPQYRPAVWNLQCYPCRLTTALRGPQHKACDMKPAICGLLYATCIVWHTPWVLQSVDFSLRPAARSLWGETCSVTSLVGDPQSEGPQQPAGWDVQQNPQWVCCCMSHAALGLRHGVSNM